MEQAKKKKDTPPGEQSPSVKDIMQGHFSTLDWSQVLDGCQTFDYIIAGSGFTGYAFASQVLKENSKARILMLERGPFFLTEHLINNPINFKVLFGGKTETFPFTQSSVMKEYMGVQYMHGSCPFVGGRSSWWLGWCPQVPQSKLRDWPKEFAEISAAPNFWKDCQELLHVKRANEIDTDIYTGLQTSGFGVLSKYRNIFDPENSFQVEHAPLAVGNKTSSVKFHKYSVQDDLLDLHLNHKENFNLITDCVVKKILASNECDGTVQALYLETSLGAIPIGSAKVIIAIGAIPATTLLMNSIPKQVPLAGTRLTGHFVSHIAARIPMDKHFICDESKFQVGSYFVAGLYNNNRQFHSQITIVHNPDPHKYKYDAARESPSSSLGKIDLYLGSENHIVLLFSILGEFSELNKKNFIKKNASHDVTTNVTVQCIPNEEDLALWDYMEDSAYLQIKALAEGDEKKVEYWHPYSEQERAEAGGKSGRWLKHKPSDPVKRSGGGIVHEGSSLWVGQDATNSVCNSIDFRPHGVTNVHILGGSLFPSVGSWNPTPLMCGHAQYLARKLEKKV